MQNSLVAHRYLHRLVRLALVLAQLLLDGLGSGRRAGVVVAVKDGGGLDADAVVVVLGVAAGPDPPRPQPEEHRADQLAEARGVDGVLLALVAVLQVVAAGGG